MCKPTLGSVFTARSFGNCESNDLFFVLFFSFVFDLGTEPLKFPYLPFVLALVQLAAQFVLHMASDAFFLVPSFISQKFTCLAAAQRDNWLLFF